MLFEAGTQFVKRGSHALAFSIARVEHCTQLDAPLILLDEQHEYGIAGRIRDGREIVQAIIEHAYYRSRQRSIWFARAPRIQRRSSANRPPFR